MKGRQAKQAKDKGETLHLFPVTQQAHFSCTLFPLNPHHAACSHFRPTPKALVAKRPTITVFKSHKMGTRSKKREGGGVRVKMCQNY